MMRTEDNGPWGGRYLKMEKEKKKNRKKEWSEVYVQVDVDTIESGLVNNMLVVVDNR